VDDEMHALDLSDSIHVTARGPRGFPLVRRGPRIPLVGRCPRISPGQAVSEDFPWSGGARGFPLVRRCPRIPPGQAGAWISPVVPRDVSVLDVKLRLVKKYGPKLL